MNRKPSQTKITAFMLLFNPNDSAIEKDIGSGSIASNPKITQNETQMTVPISSLLLALNWLIIRHMKKIATSGTSH